MGTVHFKKSVMIHAPIEVVYGFHCDTRNLAKITPPSMHVEVLKNPTPPYVGGPVVLDITQFGITQRWELYLSQVDEPRLIEDTAIRSIFKSWRHAHRFIAHEKGTEMIDEVEFELPFGILGRLATPIVRWQLDGMFRYRHHATKTALEGSSE